MGFSAFYLTKSWILPSVLRSEFHNIFRANELMLMGNLQPLLLFFFLVKKRLLSSIRDVWNSAKFLKILPISLFYVLLKCLVEKMILIVLKSFRELKFLVAILERFGNYLSIKTFKCQSSLFQDCFWKSTRLSILLFFFLILMKMFFVWNVGTSSDVFKTKVLSLCKRKDGTLRTGLSPVVCTLKWQKMFTFRTGVV